MSSILNFFCGNPVDDRAAERSAQVAAQIPALLTSIATFGLPYLFARLCRWYVFGVF